MSARPVLLARVTKRYGPMTAVDDLSFGIRPGAATGFLGPDVTSPRPACSLSGRGSWPLHELNQQYKGILAVSSLAFLPSLQQTVALGAARQMRSLATSALPDAPVIPVDDRRARRAPGAASRAVASGLRRTAERLAPATR